MGWKGGGHPVGRRQWNCVGEQISKPTCKRSSGKGKAPAGAAGSGRAGDSQGPVEASLNACARRTWQLLCWRLSPSRRRVSLARVPVPNRERKRRCHGESPLPPLASLTEDPPRCEPHHCSLTLGQAQSFPGPRRAESRVCPSGSRGWRYAGTLSNGGRPAPGGGARAGSTGRAKAQESGGGQGFFSASCPKRRVIRSCCCTLERYY